MIINILLDLLLIGMSITGYFFGFFNAFSLEENRVMLLILMGIGLLTYYIFKVMDRKVKLCYLLLIGIAYLFFIGKFTNGIKIFLTAIFEKWAVSDHQFNIPYLSYTYSLSDYRIAIYLINIPIVVSLSTYYTHKKYLLLHYLLAILFLFIPLLYQFFPEYIYLTLLIVPVFVDYLSSYLKDQRLLRIIFLVILMLIPITMEKVINKEDYTRSITFTELKSKINHAGHSLNSSTIPDDVIDLTKVGPKAPSEDIELYVEGDDLGDFKLIGNRYAIFTDNSWQKDTTDDETSLWATERRILNLHQDHVVYDCIIYNSNLVRNNYYQPYFVTFSGNGTYTFISYIDIYHNDYDDLYANQISSLEYYIRNHIELDTYVPDHLKEVLQSILDEAEVKEDDSLSDKLSKIRKYITSNYTYDLTVSAIDSDEDFVLNFIETKRGYCVHFATLTALLLRQCNVLTRYVEGYQVSEYNNSEGRYLLRNSDQHAWIEYFDDHVGWLPLETTPLYDDASSYASYRETEETHQEEVNEEEREDIEEKEKEDIENPVEQETEETLPEDPTQNTASDATSFKTALIILGIILLIVIIRVTRMLQFRKYKKQSNNQYVLFLYHQLDRLHLIVDDKLYKIALKAMYSNEMITQEELSIFEEGYIQTLKEHLNYWNFIFYYYYFMIRGK